MNGRFRRGNNQTAGSAKAFGIGNLGSVSASQDSSSQNGSEDYEEIDNVI